MSWTDEEIIRVSQEIGREKFEELLAGGASVDELIRRTGLARSTVYRRIERAGMAPGVSGPPRLSVCKRGHSMAQHGVEIPKSRGGGRYCSQCKRERERKS